MSVHQANVFLRSLDLSYNGFGRDGAASLGEALKDNNTLEELDISNNRIPPEGAIRFTMGLRVNKTIRALRVRHTCDWMGFCEQRQGLGGREMKRRQICLTLSSRIALPPVPDQRSYVGRLVYITQRGTKRLFFRDTRTCLLMRACVETVERFHIPKLVEPQKVQREGFLHLMGRNPIQTAGCYGVLKSLQENSQSSVESLDFSDIPVNPDFEDLLTSVKGAFPNLTVKHGGRIDAFRKAKR